MFAACGYFELEINTACGWIRQDPVFPAKGPQEKKEESDSIYFLIVTLAKIPIAVTT